MRVSGPTLDATDPIALAEFYERLLGWPIVRREGPRSGNPPTDGWAMLRSPAGDLKIEVQPECLGTNITRLDRGTSRGAP